MFDSIKNQENAKEFFSRVFETKKLVRSYLFLGDNKVDKKILAFELAKLLNCDSNKKVWLDKLGTNQNQNSLFAVEEFQEKEYQEPCGTCQSCLWLNERSHPKTPVFIEGSGAKNTIQVETIRKLQEDLCQSSEHFRIVVFEEASNQVLNKSSSAALLKTIEEAKPNTMFLFFADSKDNVLSTIVSRCQYVHFKASDSHEYEEELLDLTKEIKDFVSSTYIKDALERISFSEKLAEQERDTLVKAFSLLQKEFSDSHLGLDNAKSIFACEELIYDLKSFIKVKSALKDFFDKIVNLEYSLEPA